MDERVKICQQQASDALKMFLRNLSHVPEDKLNWAPSPTSKSTLQIAAHCAGFAGGFASILRDCSFPSKVEDFLNPIHAAVDGVKTVSDAEALLRKGMAEVIEALENVQPEQIEKQIETPIGSTPFQFFMTIPANHLLIHMGQIDYLQTCWDDQEVYFE